MRTTRSQSKRAAVEIANKQNTNKNHHRNSTIFEPMTIDNPTPVSNFTPDPEICPVCDLPDDGSIMVCCDQCEKWFHGNCVDFTTTDELIDWTCHLCPITVSTSSIVGSSQITHSSSINTENSKSCLIKWLSNHVCEGGSMLKDELHTEFKNFCECNGIPQMQASSIGLIIKKYFGSKVSTSRRRAEKHGKSQYHYIGIHLRSTKDDQVRLEFCEILAKLKSNVPTLRRCPKGARIPLAKALINLIQNCCTNNTVKSWHRLLSFSYIGLPAVLEQNKKTCSLTSKVKNNILILETINDDNCLHYINDLINKARCSNFPREKDSDNLSKRVLSKLSDGDVKGAVRLLSSEEILAPQDDKTFTTLELKHPPPHDLMEITDQYPSSSEILQVDATEVQQAIFSFPNGSSGGLDGLHPQILKDLLKIGTGDFGTKLLESITCISNLMLRGEVPEPICTVLYGASLTALMKKCGGIRPIAVGSVFRRLVAKLGCAFCMKNLQKLFYPIQLGFGTKNGAEIGAHSARQFFNFPHETTKIFLKIDYSNAFNMICRRKMLFHVQKEIPELYKFISQCYQQPSKLYWNSREILSQRGCQQGDPLGPALFSLVLLPLAKSMKSEFNFWYLDDGALGGDPATVLEDLSLLIEKSKEIGLNLNTSKCEMDVIGDLNDFLSIYDAFNAVAPGISTIDYDKAELLGAPLNIESIRSVFTKKISKLQLMSDRLKSLPSHSAYYLLKHSIAIPRVVYLLRVSPLWKCPDLLQVYDDTLQKALEEISNCKLTERSSLQASLPVRLGGLGVIKAYGLSLPCFLASISSAKEHFPKILPLYITDHSENLVSEGIDLWKSLYNSESPVGILSKIQKCWEQPIFSKVRDDLLNSCDNREERAVVLASQVKESGSWLNALPSQNLGTLLDDQAFRIAVALRLGSKMCIPHKCRCGEKIDDFGRHGLACKLSAGRHFRHNMVNDIIKRALITAECPSVREPVGVSRTDGKRPDGMTLIPWARGKSLLWDFTCVDTYAMSYLPSTSENAGSAATIAEDKKFKKYENLVPEFLFIPVAIETSGVWGQNGLKFIKELGRRIANITGERNSTS